MDDIILNMLAKQSGSFKREGDYINSAGILICGKCGEPRTTIKEFPPGSGKNRAFPIVCRCDREEDERFDRRMKAQTLQDKIKALRRSGVMDAAYNNYTFANDDGRNPKITASCNRYVDRWAEMENIACGVLFYGDVGGGKSFYAACIANALLDKGVPALMTRLSYLVNNRVRGERGEMPIKLNQYRLIVLDDIGAENISQTAFDIVNDIYLANIPIICTTNLTPSELKAAPNIEKQRVYNRLLERCAKKCLVPVIKSRLDTSRELDRMATQILSQ